MSSPIDPTMLTLTARNPDDNTVYELKLRNIWFHFILPIPSNILTHVFPFELMCPLCVIAAKHRKFRTKENETHLVSFYRVAEINVSWLESYLMEKDGFVEASSFDGPMPTQEAMTIFAIGLSGEHKEKVMRVLAGMLANIKV